MGEKRTAYRVLVCKPKVKKPLGRSRLRWKYNINTQLKEIGWESMDWIDLAQDRGKWLEVVNGAMNLQVLYHVRYFWSS
jgi:hypothetical protein